MRTNTHRLPVAQRANFAPSPASTGASYSPARIQMLAARLHALGPRPLAELLIELVAGADLGARLDVYAALDPATVHALGADRMPPVVRLVGGCA